MRRYVSAIFLSKSTVRAYALTWVSFLSCMGQGWRPVVKKLEVLRTLRIEFRWIAHRFDETRKTYTEPTSRDESSVPFCLAWPVRT